MRHTVQVTLDKKEVQQALAEFAFRKVDLGCAWKAERDVLVTDCHVSGAVLTLRPNADLRDRAGEKLAAPSPQLPEDRTEGPKAYLVMVRPGKDEREIDSIWTAPETAAQRSVALVDRFKRQRTEGSWTVQLREMEMDYADAVLGIVQTR